MSTNDVLLAASTSLAGLAAVLGVLAVVSSASPRAGLGVFLDLVLAAGLLRLAVADTWGAIAVAAGVVAVRELAVTGSGRGAPGELD